MCITWVNLFLINLMSTGVIPLTVIWGGMAAEDCSQIVRSGADWKITQIAGDVCDVVSGHLVE